LNPEKGGPKNHRAGGGRHTCNRKTKRPGKRRLGPEGKKIKKGGPALPKGEQVREGEKGNCGGGCWTNIEKKGSPNLMSLYERERRVKISEKGRGGGGGR